MTFTINEKTKEGKSIVAILRLLADKTKAVNLIDEVEDDALAKAIRKGRKNDFVPRHEVMKLLK
jgi:hypothetical protein